MKAAGEHRGIAYAIPNNDDGVWRWVIYPGKSKLAHRDLPRPAYAMRDDAVNEAKFAIDRLLDRTRRTSSHVQSG
jgi:hypothetical protein